jgi:hypothetical protein
MANSFHVSLDGMKLSKAQLTQIEKGISEVVMKTVAGTDLSRGFVFSRKNSFLDGIEIRGIYAHIQKDLVQF